MNINKVTLHIVGCGGLAYHSMSGMLNVLFGVDERVDTLAIHVWDKDETEARNKYRQWTRPGVFKAEIVGSILRSVGTVKVHKEMFSHETVVGLSVKEKSCKRDNGMGCVLVVGLPDNHMARTEIYDLCSEVAAGYKNKNICVGSIVAGNSAISGYAFGMWHTEHEDKYDWMKSHKDIREEAEKEKKKLAEAVSCMDNGEPIQSVNSNMLTAGLIVALLDEMLAYDEVGKPCGGYEYTWFNTKDEGYGPGVVTHYSMFR